ncbi:MAG: NAD-dependent epimerase/dehydratase family protein [Methylorubrum extorquens]|uniref:NAD-dependent epimerase/dehydratase family protein n=1 Tax=Methylorubrum extorquens TaxID=408 RepID=UPI002FEE1828
MSDLAGKLCVVFGATGFIGWNLCQRLLREGAIVRGVFRKELSTHQRQESRIQWMQGNLVDRAFVSNAVAGCHIVFNLASTSSPGNYNLSPAADVFDNVLPALQLAEISASAGVERFIFASSGGTVYGAGSEYPVREASPTEPISAYGVGKLTVEKYLEVCRRHLHLSCVSLRISNPYGPHQSAHKGQGLVAKLLDCASSGEKMIIWGDGRIVRDYVHVHDVVSAFSGIAKSATDIGLFNVGSGRGSTVNELIALVELVSGRQIQVEYVPGRAADVPINVLDSSLIAETIHWKPEITLEDGVADTWNWYASANQ